MNLSGFVMPALTLGLGAVSVKTKRGFVPMTGNGVGLDPHVTLEENHFDDLEITEHPVEQGAAIADHAFKRPGEVVIKCAWSNSPPGSGGLLGTATGLAAAIGGSGLRTVIGAATTVGSLLSGAGASSANAIYGQFLALQRARELLTVYTGKRKYSNMLIKSIAVTTDAKSENALMLTITCREVLLVATSVVKVTIAPKTSAAKSKFGQIKDFGQAQLNKVPSTILNFTGL